MASYSIMLLFSPPFFFLFVMFIYLFVKKKKKKIHLRCYKFNINIWGYLRIHSKQIQTKIKRETQIQVLGLQAVLRMEHVASTNYEAVTEEITD